MQPTHKPDPYTTPIPTIPGTDPSVIATATPATSHHQHKRGNTPDHFPTRPPVLTSDLYLDTFFNPVWTSGPHVFSFARDGTVVHPETYASEPYPGYYADRTRWPESVNASCSQGRTRGDPKPWKNVAITEQDDAEFAVFQERMRMGAVGEWRQYAPYGPAQPMKPEELQSAYAWSDGRRW